MDEYGDGWVDICVEYKYMVLLIRPEERAKDRKRYDYVGACLNPHFSFRAWRQVSGDFIDYKMMAWNLFLLIFILSFLA